MDLLRPGRKLLFEVLSDTTGASSHSPESESESICHGDMQTLQLERAERVSRLYAQSVFIIMGP